METKIKTYKELNDIENDVQTLLDRISKMLRDNISSGRDENTNVLCAYKTALFTARAELTEALSKFEL